MRRFSELDGLRGIAALLVVFSHYTGQHNVRYPGDPAPIIDLWWGAFGVQLFFLISGFVILMSAQAARRPSDFVISRVTRLYPAYWVSLIIGVGVAVWAAVPQIPLSWGDILINMTMVQRWFQVPNVVDVYWTLAIEMQFYVLLFVLLLASRCRLTDRLMANVAVAWLIVSLGVAVWAFPMSHGIGEQYVATPVRLVINASLAAYGPLFCTGILAYISRRSGKLHWLLLPAVGVAVLTTGLLQTWQNAIWIGGIAVLFLAVTFRKTTTILLIKPIQWLGLISYSLYLTHRIVGDAVIHALVPFLGRQLAVVAATVVACLVAWCVYEIAERRMSPWARRALLRIRDGDRQAA